MLTLGKCASLEGFASMVVVWFFGVLLTSLSAMSNTQSTFYGSTYLAVTIVLFLTLLIRIMTPLTGGHLSPIVTISLCIAGLTPPLQALCYLIAQMTGATFAGILLAVSLGSRATEIENYGCYFNPTPEFNALHVFIFEFMGAICVIAMMYGLNTSLGPQDQTYSLQINPFLNSVALGLFVFAASDFAPPKSYGGTNGFPTRCWASSVAIFKFESTDWIFWLPAMSAATLHGLAYRFLKPCVEESVVPGPSDLPNNLISNANPSSFPPSDVIIQMGNPESSQVKEKS
ncbi:hypothetical protein PGT21_015656 [Puccinia graminis f. sp. tritici]|uniref:Aquaporin n=1 Tax=Puccinia graminis f. sp. tritici TaxID=56615 RepID=A0A5B0PNW2_PUCGR|nr:hypothetical protein PGT21_015656 [Puccinia graminis f. sp. tritici]